MVGKVLWLSKKLVSVVNWKRKIYLIRITNIQTI